MLCEEVLLHVALWTITAAHQDPSLVSYSITKLIPVI